MVVSASSMKASAALCIISGRPGLHGAALTKYLQPQIDQNYWMLTDVLTKYLQLVYAQKQGPYQPEFTT